MRHRIFLALLTLVVLFSVLSSMSYAQFGEETRRLPSDTNTILLLNVDQVHQSPLGIKENWRKNHETSFEGGLVIVPPQAKTFVLAAKLNFETMQPIWQVAMMELEYEANLATAAARFNGTLDRIGEREVAVLPGNIAAIKMGKRWAGMRQPAVRQDVARWLEDFDSLETGRLSPYMTASVNHAKAGAPLIMAIDLKHMISATQVRPVLDELQSLKGKTVDKDKLAQVLSSIEGVSLGVTVGKERFGKIKVDFAEDATIMAPFARELLLEILGRRGMMIDEFATWKLGGSTKQITLEGTLYGSGSRRILSVLDAPPELHQQASSPSETDDQEDQQKLMAMASKQYFNAIVTMLDDLDIKQSEAKMVSWNQVGTWWEKYARKIDRLPTLNVDPELLEFGAWVSDTMRDAEASLKGIAPASKQRQTETPNYYKVHGQSAPIGMTRRGVYGWSGYTVTEDLKSKGQAYSNIRRQERIRGNMAANTIAQGLQGSIGDMRRHLTQKYQIQF